jgi:CRISPR/Cas system-associated endoribonuclease Cas2
MYKVNINDKTLTKLTPTDFTSENLLERYDIQEWIEKTPDILGEDFLIIGKELLLPSGSRLDLLAIDKNARLVIIELKRDESGKDVDWQAIKYTSYCSNFLVEEIISHYASYLNPDEEEAKARIDEFIDEELEILNHSQRIILVSKKYHSDVISAVLWLRDYGVDIECLRLKPFLDDSGELFVQPDKIIPLPEAKDYIIKKEKKQKEIKRAQGSFDKGEVVETAYVAINKGTFRIERYDSTSIRVYNVDSESYETAKPLLREINTEKELSVNLLNSRGNEKNTRSLGKDIISELKAQGKEYPSEKSRAEQNA